MRLILEVGKNEKSEHEKFRSMTAVSCICWVPMLLSMDMRTEQRIRWSSSAELQHEKSACLPVSVKKSYLSLRGILRPIRICTYSKMFDVIAWRFHLQFMMMCLVCQPQTGHPRPNSAPLHVEKENQLKVSHGWMKDYIHASSMKNSSSINSIVEIWGRYLHVTCMTLSVPDEKAKPYHKQNDSLNFKRV